MKRVNAGVLDVAYVESGPADGSPVVLLHGFPYDVHSYDLVAHRLSSAGRRVIVPYLRGYGPTHFLHRDTPRVASRPHLAPTSFRCWMRSRSSARQSRATTGEVEPPAWSPRCGPIG